MNGTITTSSEGVIFIAANGQQSLLTNFRPTDEQGEYLAEIDGNTVLVEDGENGATVSPYCEND